MSDRPALRPEGLRQSLSWWRLATLGLVLLATVLSSLSPRLSPPPEFDKVAHAASFLILAVMACWALPVGMVAVGCGLLLVGVGIEGLQGLMAAGRSADPADVGADVVGIAVGLVIWAAVGLVRRSRAPAGEEPAGT